MKKVLKENIKPFLITTTFMGAGLFGYMYHLTNTNYMTHLDKMLNE
jgi:hypothetical protein